MQAYDQKHSNHASLDYIQCISFFNTPNRYYYKSFLISFVLPIHSHHDYNGGDPVRMEQLLFLYTYYW
uniref:Uncharacterized protein n=1 Tax=Octopus bimaculoides TaxID=37653 RepID=A0A0L8FTT1_OCTBM